MSSEIRAAALSAVALVACQAASASFVYQSANRDVRATVNGAVVDPESTTAYGSWFGSASANSANYVILATQGSNLAAGEMTFVGASQIDASAAANLGASSTATVTFLSDATETIRWIANLARASSGAGNSAAISMSVIDVAAGTPLLAFTGPSTGSGSFDVVAGRTYRVTINSSASASGSANAVSDYNVGFFSTVPAPGAIALLGFAGIAGRRRR